MRTVFPGYVSFLHFPTERKVSLWITGYLLWTFPPFSDSNFRPTLKRPLFDCPKYGNPRAGTRALKHKDVEYIRNSAIVSCQLTPLILKSSET